MNFEHLKVQIPALVASVGTGELVSMEATDQAGIVGLVVQVIIGILSILGFFRDRKKQPKR